MDGENPEYRLSRRALLVGAGASGLAVAAPTLGSVPQASASPALPDGTPEQVHLTWGADPTKSVVVSWASPAPSTNPRVTVRGEPGGEARTVPAVQRIYTDGINGQTVWTYHAALHHLRPDAAYGYSVAADNDSNAADPFTATLRTAPRGRAPFRFTSFGDLATRTRRGSCPTANRPTPSPRPTPSSPCSIS
jgi:alkaline phosphatase D